MSVVVRQGVRSDRDTLTTKGKVVVNPGPGEEQTLSLGFRSWTEREGEETFENSLFDKSIENKNRKVEPSEEPDLTFVIPTSIFGKDSSIVKLYWTTLRRVYLHVSPDVVLVDFEYSCKYPRCECIKLNHLDINLVPCNKIFFLFT